MSIKKELLEIVQRVKLGLLLELPKELSNKRTSKNKPTPSFSTPSFSPKALQEPPKKLLVPSIQKQKEFKSQSPATSRSFSEKTFPLKKDFSDVLASFKKYQIPLSSDSPNDFSAKQVASSWKKEVFTAFFLLEKENEKEKTFFEKVVSAVNEKLFLAKIITELPSILPPTLECLFYSPSVKISLESLTCRTYRLEEVSLYERHGEKKRLLWQELKDLL